MSTDVPQRLSVWRLVLRCCPVPQWLTFIQTSEQLREANGIFTASVFEASAGQRAQRSRPKSRGAGAANGNVFSRESESSWSLQVRHLYVCLTGLRFLFFNVFTDSRVSQVNFPHRFISSREILGVKTGPRLCCVHSGNLGRVTRTLAPGSAPTCCLLGVGRGTASGETAWS